MSDDFHILPDPSAKQAATDCPLLKRDGAAWIACCTRRFFPLARRIVGDESLAEDILQVSWIKILQTTRPCQSHAKACPWVHRIVANTAKDFQRKRVRRREDPLQDQLAPTRDPEALAQESELLVLLKEMIDLLPGTYRQVMKLRLYQDFSTKQISQDLHISRGNVAVRMNRAITLLKRHIDARARSLAKEGSRQF